MIEMLFALAVGALAAAGLWLALGRDLLGAVIGFGLIGAAANLFLFATGRLGASQPPLVPEGATHIAGVADPLPQALTLTAVVIGFALACLSVALVLALGRDGGTAGPLEASEPPAKPDGSPGRLT